MNPDREKELLEIIDQTIAEGPFAPDWDSLMQAKIPAWFRERRLGIFIHWGLYSVPANSNEWYSRKENRDKAARRDYFDTEKNKRLRGDIYITQIIDEEMNGNDARLR